MVSIIFSALSDLFFQYKSRFFFRKKSTYSFAFLVHSRGQKDIYRKFPFFKYFPTWFVLWFMKSLWPITLSRVTGLKSIVDNTEVQGYVIGITMTAKQMMQDKEKALQKIRQAVHVARGKGVQIVGLGGLTSSLSGGGTKLVDIDINITTGHAYTAYNVTKNVLRITELFEIPKEKLKIAVVGAAGSIGSISAEILARAGYQHIVLIDIPRKRESIEKLAETMRSLYHTPQVVLADSVGQIKGCDIVVTATNTPEALVTVDMVHDGMVIIDDAQPSDIHPDVLKLPSVLVLEAGVVHTPGVQSNFNYGLKNRTDNFCCMAELLILASHLWDNHYVISRATLAHVDEISAWGETLGFTVASFQNFLESITQEKLDHVKKAYQQNHAIHT